MKNKQIAVFLFLQAFVSVFIILKCNGTGDSGDSVMHYLFAKYSFHHPELFYHHWAKPLYVLLASPFAQFGFQGMKVFNVLVMLLTSFFTFKTIQQLKIANPVVGILLMVCSPLVFVLTFSGLTEPLFALFLIAGIYLLLANHFVASCLIISFLPFIRSEGLILIGVFGLYFLLKKKWHWLPLLMVGHIVYAIAGYHVHKDLLWVLNKIPYATLSSQYTDLYSKEGRLFHFVEQMNYVVGVPVYFLFWIGVVAIVYQIIKKKITKELSILVLFGFFAFFIAHTLFWYFGIFNSMGLKRVLVGVAPLSSIIALEGFNNIGLLFEKRKRLSNIISVLVMLCVVVFPFTSNPAAINWKRDMMLTTEQQISDKVAAFINSHQLEKRRFLYDIPYLSESLNIDHFDPNKRIDLNGETFREIRSGDIVVWENWFSVVDGGVTKDKIEEDSRFEKRYEISGNENSREIVFCVFECK